MHIFGRSIPRLTDYFPIMHSGSRSWLLHAHLVWQFDLAATLARWLNPEIVTHPVIQYIRTNSLIPLDYATQIYSVILSNYYITL